ncbi:MAG: YbjN domain-containing protein [Pseudomonadota bacterium]
MRITNIIMAVLFGILGTAVAQPVDPVSRPTDLVESLSFEDIGPVLTEAGIPNQVQVVNGQQVMLAEIQGTKVQFRRRACVREDKCAGLWMFAYINDTSTPEVLHEFNKSSKPARAMLFDNAVVLDRYLIADYGTARGSLIINVRVFAQMVRQWFTFSQQNGPVQVSFQPLMQTRPLTEIGFTHDEQELLELMSVNRTRMNFNPNPSTNAVTGQR